MASIDNYLDCQGCTTPIPQASFDECNPEILQAQISDLYIWNDGYPLTDWTNAAEWASRISNSSSNLDAIRHLTVIGALADPTHTEKKGSHQRRRFTPWNFAMTFDVDDNTDVNYDLARSTGCGRSYRFAYSTLGQKLYSNPGTNAGNLGILGNLQMWEPITNSEDDDVNLKGSLSWTDRFLPVRVDNPMAV